MLIISVIKGHDHKVGRQRIEHNQRKITNASGPPFLSQYTFASNQNAG